MGNLFLVVVLILVGGTALYYYQPTMFPHSFREYIEDAKDIIDPNKEPEEASDAATEEPEDQRIETFVDYGKPVRTEAFDCSNDAQCIMSLGDNWDTSFHCNVSSGSCYRII